MYKSSFFLLFLSLFTSLIAEEQGLERLMQGNQRYVQDALEHPNRTTERREAVVSLQEPFAVILGCADSRVAPEILFDQGVGDLFVVRVAGNVVGSLELESIEYAVFYLNSSVILVLGHENCGAVHAVLEGTTKDIEDLAKLIEPSVQEVKNKNLSDPLEEAIKANARRMRDNLRQAPGFQKLIQENKLDIQAGYYHLQTGEVEIIK